MKHIHTIALLLHGRRQNPMHSSCHAQIRPTLTLPTPLNRATATAPITTGGCCRALRTQERDRNSEGLTRPKCEFKVPYL